jgi:anaerobic selenocysteine-containing dehydrogenase
MTAGICARVHCEAMCGLEIRVESGRVISIRANRDDVWSRGHICPKGVSLAALHHDPDRVRRPLIKVDGRWQEVSWDAAFRRCTELLTPVIRKYGIGAVTAHTGNPGDRVSAESERREVPHGR